MLARVSNIEAFRQWQHWRPLHEEDVEPSVEDLVRRITVHEPSEAMKVGTAFHRALELADDAEVEVLSCYGYTFHLAGGEIVVPEVRELRQSKVYGGLTVTGKADGIVGFTVIDHKTTKRLDAERYLDGCAWRFYLDIFGADVFRWNVFEIKPDRDDPMVYHVGEPQILTAHRYPALQSDCAALAAAYLEFATEHLPADFNPIEDEEDD